MMMSIQYILGALTGPINSYVSLIQTLQDVKISLERLNDVYEEPLEDVGKKELIEIDTFLKCKQIVFSNVAFHYNNDSSIPVLDDVSFSIEFGKVTAIVGASGSGKTSLTKLLLKLYEPSSGDILFDKLPISGISSENIRSLFSVVMQDGFIFSDSVLGNIVINKDTFDKDKFYYALRTAELLDVVDELPLKEHSLIGRAGQGLSQGQKQRVLLARAIYRDTPILILDEATNALDSSTEFKVMNNLRQYAINRTVIVIAHRLSTIYMSDKIVVMNSGKVIESGVHHELLGHKGHYYNLVNKQVHSII